MAQRAMGVTCDVTVVGENGISILRDSLARVARLETLWSRFREGSDISRLNRSAGAPTWVSAETVLLVRHMIAAHGATDGLFDPTLLPSQLAAGDRASLVGDGADTCPVPERASHSVDDIDFLDDFVIRLPVGLLLDAGGIGKGLAADMTASAAMHAGAAGVCINIGGDMRCLGDTPDPRGWTVMISSPVDYATHVAGACIADGAVATSALGARSRAGSGMSVHVFDPRTGAPSVREFAGASIVAGSGAWAEAFTKYVLLGDPAVTFGRLDSMDIGCLAVTHDGEVRTNDAWARTAL